MRTLLCGIAAAALTLAQAPATQPPTTSLVLAGRVMTGTGDQARPVRHARVTLTGAALKGARIADTDTKGEYRFERIPAGEHKLSVQKSGFVKLDAPAVPDALLTLVRGGAIEGVVTDAGGDPVMNVLVTALDRPSGGGTPKTVAQTRTDDLGRYRLHSLDAGDYLVQAATDRVFILNMGMSPGQRSPETTGAYYPAALTADEARPVHVTLGGNTSGVDVSLTPNPPLTDPAGPPARPAEELKGTGRIAGRITDGTSGKSIKGAHLLLLPTDGVRITNWTSTDVKGRYEYTGLAARKYTLQAGADRFVTLEYGRKRPGETGVPIPVMEGQDVSVDMALPRTSAVEGTLTDEFGDPIPSIGIQITRRQFVAGRQRLVPLGGRIQPLQTDDTGHYRVFGVEPGEYFVQAVSGAFVDQDATGGFAPTFYPGSTDAAAASPVTVSVGADTLGVSFSLIAVKTVSVSGTMVGSDGKPIVGRGTLWLTPPDRLKRADVNMARAVTTPDGQFVLRNVPPGTYTMQGFGTPPAGYHGPMNLAAMPFGWTSIAVGETDSDGVVLRVTDGTTLRGHIAFEESAKPLPVDQVHVLPIPVEFDSAPIAGGPSPSEIHPDWTFEVTHLSGQRRILVSVSSPAWALKKVTRGGIDVTEAAVDFRTKDVDDVEVLLTPKITRVSGAVSDDAGPSSEYAVVIFASDPTKWGDRSRFVTVAPGTKQGFEARLPPEDYLAVALPSATQGEIYDPDFLQSLWPLATAFSLQEGESKTLALKLKKKPGQAPAAADRGGRLK